jgi:hypothetical protein
MTLRAAPLFLLAVACAGRPRMPGTSVAQPINAAPVASNHVSRENSHQQRTGHVTVALVIDQFAAWIARERLPLLPAATREKPVRPSTAGPPSCTGGFARLRDEGTWFTDVRFAHAITETAVGHASLHTGRTPREHGIVANELRIGGASRGILVDPGTRVVSRVGVGAELGSSAGAVQSELVADQLRNELPGAKIYALSLKDRGAIVGGGHRPDLSLWYDSKLGEFVTSSAFAPALPHWVTELASRSAIEPLLSEPWTPLEPEWVKLHAFTADEQAGESDFFGYGTVFPHRVLDSEQPFAAWRGHPSSDRLLLKLALGALDHSPAESPVLLAVSLSANDYIGHWFGPDSYEAWDELRRLDQQLAEFFCELDRRQGAAHWSVVLSADHGVSPLPEVSRARAVASLSGTSSARPRTVGGRILAPELEKIARTTAARVVGKGSWIEAVIDPYLYWSNAAKRLAPDRFARLRSAVVSVLNGVPGIAHLYEVATLPATCPPHSDESLDALVCRSVRAEVGGDYFIALEAGYFFDTGYVRGYGTSHGNAWSYDRSVPLLVRAPGELAAQTVIDEPQSFTLYAQLLGRLLGLRAHQPD